MTDKEKWIAFLDEQNVYWEVPDPAIYDNVEITIPARCPPNSGTVNAGYGGFAVDLKFDENGKLLEFGVWE